MFEHSNPKIFRNPLPKEVSVLLSISDPRYPIWDKEEKKKAIEKSRNSFAKDVQLIATTANIRMVSLNLTFLVSRWNIIADLLFFIYKKFYDQNTYKPLNIDKKETELYFSELLNKAELSSESKIVYLNALNELLTLSFRLSDQSIEFSEAKKKCRELGLTFTKELESREKEWVKDNKEYIAVLSQHEKLRKEENHSYWQQFLYDTDGLRELLNLFLEKISGEKKDPTLKQKTILEPCKLISILVDQLGKDPQFVKTRGTQISSQINTNYSGVKGVIKKLVSFCIEYYLSEESIFVMWLRIKLATYFDMETHDGNLTSAPKRAMEMISNALGKNPIPFNEITDSKENKMKPEQKYYFGNGGGTHFFLSKPSFTMPNHKIFSPIWENENIAHFVGRNGHWAWAVKIDKNIKTEKINDLIEMLNGHKKDSIPNQPENIIFSYAWFGEKRMEYRIEVAPMGNERSLDDVKQDIAKAIEKCITNLEEWRKEKSVDTNMPSIAQ